MTTRIQLGQQIANDYAERARAALTMQDLNRALNNLTQQERQDLLRAVREEQGARVGQIIVLAVRDRLKTEAIARASEILADGALSAAELTEWLGE